MKTAILFAIITLFAVCHSPAAPAANDSTDRSRLWQEDIDYFAKELPARHKEFYRLIPKNEFDRKVAKLKREVPQFSDSEIILQLTRIVAGLGVAHTFVQIPLGSASNALHVYPIRMQWFSDVLAVIAAAPEYREALGGRVVRIGSMTPKGVEAAVAPYISHENNAWLHIQSPRYMMFEELMRQEKIADAAGRLQLTCAKADGKEFTFEVAPAEFVETDAKWVTAQQAFRIPTEFCRKQPKAFYWYEYLPDTHTLYIQYSKCLDEPGNPFADFVNKLLAFADSRAVDRVIVDLRFNVGGTSSIVKPLIDGLKARPALSAKGHLYTLIGGRTFSSAMFAAIYLRNDLHAILIGEPTGNKPNAYGQFKSFELPNSKLKVQYSTKHFYLVRNGDPPSLDPDIFVQRSLEDYLAGRDPVLDSAIRHPLQ